MLRASVTLAEPGFLSWRSRRDSQAKSQRQRAREARAGKIDDAVCNQAAPFEGRSQQAIQQVAAGRRAHRQGCSAPAAEAQAVAETHHNRRGRKTRQRPGPRHSAVLTGRNGSKVSDQVSLRRKPLTDFAGNGVACRLRQSSNQRQEKRRLVLRGDDQQGKKGRWRRVRDCLPPASGSTAALSDASGGLARV